MRSQSCIHLMGLLFLSGISLAQPADWQTYYEKSGYKSTPRYEETIQYCKALADHSELITYQAFGQSPQGRELPLLVVNKSGFSEVEKVKEEGKAIVLVQACIHAGESDGKDAGLMLLRDLAISGKYPTLLDEVTVLFVPIFNVDGHEDFNPHNRINQNGPEQMGKRVTAQRLNLNRDFLKAESPEMQAMVHLFQAWLPDFYIDCHVTDGADYVYPLTYGLQINGNLNSSQSAWLRDVYLPFVTEAMDKSSQPIAPYMDFVEWHNPLSGIRAYIETPRYSGGYAAINNRPALLIETHMLKDYKTRVSATYNMILNSLELIVDHSKELIELNNRADREAESLCKSENPYVLSFKTSDKKEKMEFKGYEFDVQKSEISGGDWYRYSDIRETFQIDKYYLTPEKTTDLPKGYIIPVEFSVVIDKLLLHGVAMENLDKDSVFTVATYQFKNVKWRPRPFEGHLILDYEIIPIERSISYSKGSKIVYLDQRAAQIAIHLLEPDAPDALVRWGFLNTIFEQKEYAESYVMEKMAREMLTNDNGLKEEFERKMESDQQFASSPNAILNWFYERTPYWDEELNVYPIGRIE